MRDHDSDEHLIWGWVIPRGGKKKPVILDRDNHDEISAITEEEIHGLGYFPLYSAPVDLIEERDRLREALSELERYVSMECYDQWLPEGHAKTSVLTRLLDRVRATLEKGGAS
ncbi:hypothetical protein ELI01_18920 [Rhizobium leguminosarum]|uniref:hypothetical protein n=1 Tax=Rhizobium leguminosarum TaxID=384 RepID=UPI00102F7803|nr:hypothetical protein [Rhizobium leguminosarum]TAX57151.1 hypothetical protein ELI01_18920 [Rhizobium leguminosarum]